MYTSHIDGKTCDCDCIVHLLVSSCGCRLLHILHDAAGVFGLRSITRPSHSAGPNLPRLLRYRDPCIPFGSVKLNNLAVEGVAVPDLCLYTRKIHGLRSEKCQLH